MNVDTNSSAKNVAISTPPTMPVQQQQQQRKQQQDRSNSASAERNKGSAKEKVTTLGEAGAEAGGAQQRNSHQVMTVRHTIKQLEKLSDMQHLLVDKMSSSDTSINDKIHHFAKVQRQNDELKEALHQSSAENASLRGSLDDSTHRVSLLEASVNELQVKNKDLSWRLVGMLRQTHSNENVELQRLGDALEEEQRFSCGLLKSLCELFEVSFPTTTTTTTGIQSENATALESDSAAQQYRQNIATSTTTGYPEGLVDESSISGRVVPFQQNDNDNENNNDNNPYAATAVLLDVAQKLDLQDAILTTARTRVIQARVKDVHTDRALTRVFDAHAELLDHLYKALALLLQSGNATREAVTRANVGDGRQEEEEQRLGPTEEGGGVFYENDYLSPSQQQERPMDQARRQYREGSVASVGTTHSIDVGVGAYSPPAPTPHYPHDTLKEQQQQQQQQQARRNIAPALDSPLHRDPLADDGVDWTTVNSEGRLSSTTNNNNNPIAATDPCVILRECIFCLDALPTNLTEFDSFDFSGVSAAESSLERYTAPLAPEALHDLRNELAKISRSSRRAVSTMKEKLGAEIARNRSATHSYNTKINALQQMYAEVLLKVNNGTSNNNDGGGGHNETAVSQMQDGFNQLATTPVAAIGAMRMRSSSNTPRGVVVTGATSRGGDIIAGGGGGGAYSFVTAATPRNYNNSATPSSYAAGGGNRSSSMHAYRQQQQQMFSGASTARRYVGSGGAVLTAAATSTPRAGVANNQSYHSNRHHHHDYYHDNNNMSSSIISPAD